MKRLFQNTRGLAAGLALVGVTATQATAQFVAVNNYQAPPAAAQAYNAPPAAAYPTPNYSDPRVAQSTLPTPAEAIQAAAPAAPAAAATAPPTYAAPPTYSAPAMSYTQPVTPAPATMPSSYSQPMAHGATYPAAAPAGCATGNCGANYATAAPDYSYQSAGCSTGGCDVTYASAPACNVGCGPAPRPRRQWFAGVYGLYMDRAGDAGKQVLAHCTETARYTDPNSNYYPIATDQKLFSTDAGRDGMFGAEIRFGSTFGCDPCGCTQPFAWEIGYWALEDDAGSSVIALDGALSDGNAHAVFTGYDYSGVMADLDGAGTDWDPRPVYSNDGEDGDLYSTDVRILGVRVRQRFQVQNLELNFWRFGAPTVAPAFGSGFGGLAGGHGACGANSCATGSCGQGACGGGSCGAGGVAGGLRGLGGGCGVPRRFFINGLMGVRYLRVDDDFGLDQRFAVVETAAGPDQGDVPSVGNTASWVDTYDSFPIDSNQTMFSDFEADNELIGFQLGSSLNWLIGCHWNFFADTNFGIYGNNASVSKRIYGGGGAEYYFQNGGGAANVRGSETNLAFIGELRAGVGYQVSCNCRLTAAYRFIGIGGLALGAEELQSTDWSNYEAAQHINTNNSLILHGLQTGVEYKF